MKICSKCKQNKNLINFTKRFDGSKSGYKSQCKDCINTTRKQKYNNDPNLKLYISNYRLANPEKANLASIKWEKANPEKVKVKQRNNQLNNPGKYASYSAKRRAAKAKAIPKWLTQNHKQQIKAIYNLSSTLQKIYNKQFHVDHILPLRGKTVSGLHVPWNLRIILAIDNIRKNNKLI